MIKFLIIFSLLLLDPSHESEILCIFPRPAYSHQAVFRAVTQKLLERGHKLTIMSTHPSESEKNHENLTLIDVSSSSAYYDGVLKDLMLGVTNSWKDAFLRLIDAEVRLVDHQLSTPGMQKLLKEKPGKFDVLLLETLGFSAHHAFAEHFQIPVVGITSADSLSVGHEIMGNVVNPVAHPDRVLPFAIPQTFTQRLGSCVFAFLMKFMIIPSAAERYKTVTHKHFPNVNKTYHELVSNIDLLLVNAHPALGILRPILPNTIQLGFLHIKPPKPLTSELREILDNSTHGVIYMSFGTVVFFELFKSNFASFLEAFADLPYDVLLKFEEENLEKIPKNVHIRMFFPQSDLLAHRNVKLFITHGGQHSIEESIMRNVPMIVCPFQGDQFANAERVVERGIAKSLNIREKLDAGRIKNAINDVIMDESFRINIEKLAMLVDDVPMKSVDTAVWHIESVIRNKGARHLRYRQREIPFYQYHYYDMILLALGIIVLAVAVIVVIAKLIVKCARMLLNVKNKRD